MMLEHEFYVAMLETNTICFKIIVVLEITKLE